MAEPARIHLVVETYSGYRADERPVAFRLRERRVVVHEVLDRWYGEEHAYYKLTGDDGVLYLIRHDRRDDSWELILMEVPSGSPTQARHPCGAIGPFPRKTS